MKISTLAVAAVVTSLTAAIITPAVYAEDAAPTTTTAPAPACDPKDPKCKPDATTDGTAAPATDSTDAPATGSDS